LIRILDECPARAFEDRLLIVRGFIAALGKSDRKAFLRGAAAVPGPAGKGFRLAVTLLLQLKMDRPGEEEGEEWAGDRDPGANGKAT
jgi:hypothetical protein